MTSAGDKFATGCVRQEDPELGVAFPITHARPDAPLPAMPRGSLIHRGAVVSFWSRPALVSVMPHDHPQEEQHVKTVTRWISGAVLAACALSGFVSQAAAEPITPATVSFVEAPVTLATDPTGEWFPAGTVYWQADFSIAGGDGFVATWERSAGTWASVAEGEEAVRQTYRCTNEKLQTWLDSFPDIESFIGDREPLNDTPDENGRLKYAWYEPPELYEDCRAAAGWDWSRVDTTNEEESSTVRIPLDVVGPGDHQIFVVGLGSEERDPATDPECVYRKWEGERDGTVSASAYCGLIFGEPAYAWVRVPEVGEDSPGILSTSGTLPPTPLPTWVVVSLIAGGAVVTVGGVTVVGMRRHRRIPSLPTEPETPSTSGAPQ